MPTERELIAEIEKHAQSLARAVAAAEFWHGKTLEAIEQGEERGFAECNGSLTFPDRSVQFHASVL